MSRLRQPPSSLTGELAQWLQELTRSINNIPTISYFSGIHPNLSGITGTGGHILINVGSSTASRVFVNVGSVRLPNTNSWNTIG